MSATLCACMIVKDEEELLPGCLASIRGVVDDVVLVDTGSSDATREIAASHGARVLEWSWRDDFSAARNVSLSHAAGDWILVIDADERIVAGDGPRLRETMERTPSSAVSVVVRNIYRKRPPTSSASVRLFRNGRGVHYEGAVHNRITGIGPDVESSAVTLDHLGYDLDDRKLWVKHERTRRLLLAQLQARPDDPYSLVHMAHHCHGALVIGATSGADELLEYALRAARHTDPRGSGRAIHLMALVFAAQGLLWVGRHFEARRMCARVLELKPGHPDALCVFGWIELALGRRGQAVLAFERFLVAAAECSVSDPDILMLLSAGQAEQVRAALPALREQRDVVPDFRRLEEKLARRQSGRAPPAT